MPELPEVQTIVSDLNKKIINHKIIDFWSDWAKSIHNLSLNEFQKQIVGRKILKVHRWGKNIFIDLSGGKTIYVHLKMTGHLLVKDKKAEKNENFKERVNQYIHHIWTLDKGVRIEFSDLRKFGKIVLLGTKNIKDYKDIKALGIDAMDPKFTYQKFKEILDKKDKLMIGVLLMQQDLIAGIGNIYRSEILFESGISPFRKVVDLNDRERREIFKNIKAVLKLAIKLRGTSDSDYRDTAGAPGGFQKVMKVYNHEKELCKKKGCQGSVTRETMAQRSVFWCQKCQR